MWSDLKAALRTWRGQPGLFSTAVLTIAVGIGASTAIFSVVYGVLLRPLPYPEPERLVRLYEFHPGGRSALGQSWLSDTTVHAWRPSMRTLTAMAAYSTSVDSVGQTEPERWTSGVVSPGLFELLGARPTAGRFFTADEERSGAPPVVVISADLWHERYGASADALGRALWVDGVARQIIGVAPPGFRFPTEAVKFWRPQEMREAGAPGMRVMAVIGRLADGVTAEQASAEGTIAARSVPRPPAARMLFGEGGEVEVRADGFIALMTRQVRPALLVLLGGVALVLLVACANVANLLLSRGVVRQRELSVRAALGAGRFQLLRQLLTESIVIAAAGAGLGIGVGWALVRLVPRLAPASLPRAGEVHLDGLALTFAVLTAVVVGLVSGTLPALRGARGGLVPAMLDGDRRSTGTGRRLRGALLATEAALAVLLLVGAGLLARSFVALTSVDAGYNPHNVLLAQVVLPPVAAGDTMTSATADRILTRVKAIPGIDSAGAGNMAPLAPVAAIRLVTLPEVGPDGQRIQARALAWGVTPGYAEALGQRLVTGRFFRDEDAASPIQALIVNEAFVRRYWSDGKPVVGRRYEGVFAEAGTTSEVVGVIADMRKDGLDAEPEPEIYTPVRASRPTFGRGMYVAVRTAGDPAALTPELRRAVIDVEPGAALDDVSTLDARVSASVAAPRFAAAVLGGFAAAAALLAAIGLYGVLSYGVAQRRREIGVRAAVGATRGQLIGMVLAEGLTVVAIGLVAGLALAAWLSRLLQSLLFGVTPLDAWAYAAAPIVMLAVAVVAAVVPARRAAAVDPAEALRCE